MKKFVCFVIIFAIIGIVVISCIIGSYYYALNKNYLWLVEYVNDDCEKQNISDDEYNKYINGLRFINYNSSYTIYRYI